jgi:hypothetical protein
LGTHLRAKKKREEMSTALRKMRYACEISVLAVLNAHLSLHKCLYFRKVHSWFS